MADGASEEVKGFIRFTNHGSWGDLEMSESSLRERVFVGRRGSGKSRYLGEQERIAAKKMQIFEQPTEAINITSLRRVHREFTDIAEREEVWIKLWGAAIQLSLASFLLRQDLDDKLNSRDAKHVEELVRRFLGTVGTPFAVVDSLNQILNATEAKRSKLEFEINRPDWTVLEHTVSQMIGHAKPVAIFIDSLDENFRRAPAESAQAQLALILYIARGLTDSNRSNRTHIFVTVRDVIYSQFLNHEQGERYANPVHFKLLDWTKSAARFFFEQKITKLGERHLTGPKGTENQFERWLGVQEIYNPARKVKEEVGDFLLRHTRFLPREVVEIGNAICNAMNNQGQNARGLNIWSLVIKEAEHIGERAMLVLYDHIISMSDDVFVSEKERNAYRDLLEKGFREFKSALTNEVVTRADLDKADERFFDTVGDQDADYAFSDLLWQHGLIAFMYSNEAHSHLDDVAIFYHSVGGTGGSSAYKLRDADRYRLHASIIEAGSTRLEPKAPQVGSIDVIHNVRLD